MKVFGRAALCVLLAVAVVTVGITRSAQAQLSVAQSTVVNAVPASYTPDLDGGVVYALAQVGSWVVAGGSFTSATPHGSTTARPDNGLIAFDQSTGALDTMFSPTFDGQINSVLPGPIANTVFVGGAFATVNGVKSKGLTLLDLSTGAIVPGFTPAALNGAVQVLRLSGGRLYVGGTFTLAGGVTHDGLATVSPITGALDPFLNVQLTGHHNYNGTGAQGGVGARAMDISPDGSRAVVVGNFKNVNGVLSDQIVMLDLNGSAAVVDPNWKTAAFSAACSNKLFDSYVDDVDFSPDGSYFVVVATGAGTFTLNADGTRSLCDSASRWSTTDTGTDVSPSWVDYTGDDTFWSVAVTGAAVYVGGHQRWVNNPNGPNVAAVGALPRPGLVALDPANGLPLAWNPGRNPRGEGAYSLLATPMGLYVGSDTDYIGNRKYKHDEIAFFPITGGSAPASTATSSLPANVYEAGPTNTPTAGVDDLAYRTYTPPAIGAQTVVPGTGVSWSTTRGAFMVGSTLFYGSTNGNFYQASFDGTTVGTPSVVDPYDDPAWDNVQTGSGQTYQGVKPGYYSEIPAITGAFYSDGRLYYTQAGKNPLYWRYFTPDSGTIGGTEFTASGGSFAKVAGMFVSGTTIYYASSADGSLHAVTYSDGGTNGATPKVTTSTDHIVSGPKVDGRDWRARGMFLDNPPPQHQPPVASGSVSCSGLSCSFDGSGSTDSDGTIQSYAWTFGDGSTGTGEFPTHGYAQAGPETYTLVVTDDQGSTSATFTGTANPGPQTGPVVGFVGSADAYNKSGTSVSVTTPAVTLGDTEFLYVTTSNATLGAIATPAGWTAVATQVSMPVQVSVFEKTAGAGETGTPVTAAVSSAGPIAVQLLDYSDVDASTVVTAGSADANTASHTAPAVAVGVAGSWVVSFWSDKSSSTTAWTLPASVTQRDQTIGTGSGRLTAALADSGAPVATGTYPGQTATVGATPSGKAAMISLVLVPGAPVQNQPPVASGSVSCVGLSCSFDGSGSTDSDGTIQSYAWTFGDGSTGTGEFPTHGYASAGPQTFTLVVTDNDDAVSQTFTGTANPTVGSGPAIGFAGSADAYDKSGTSVSVTTPTVSTGDTELLYVTTSNATAGAIATPPGWTPVATQASSPVQVAVFERTADASDTGTPVSAAVSSAGPIAVQLLDYTNVDASTVVTAGSADANTASHTAPAVAVGAAGSWVVSFWSDKSSSTTAWLLPASVTQRDQTIGTSGGHLTAALADSGGPVATGTYPAQTATVGATPSGKAAMISLVLVPTS